MEKIGKYEVLEKIGTGGFGVVYKGRDPFIKRPVAIKTCLSDDEDMRHRFAREAEIAGNLQHRNVTTVYDFGYQGEVPYLVQEYLPGEDLDKLIEQRVLTPTEKLDYLVQIATGLEYAHSQGVIHRDIKPSNVRVVDGTKVKIMDFGIAKLAHIDSQLTKTGMTLGTASYLSPEQIRGEELTHGVDIFAFGVLGYELWAHRRPFIGASLSNLFYQILSAETPPLRTYAPDCPASLATVIERCLHKEPTGRWATCTELREALEEVREEVSRLPADGGATTHMRVAPDAPDDQGQTVVLSKSRARRELAVVQARIEELLAAGDPTAAEIEISLARKRFLDMPDAAVTLEPLQQKALEARQRQDEGRRRGEKLAALLSRGRTLAAAGEHAEAALALRTALEHDPRSAEASKLLAEVEQNIAEVARRQALSDGVATLGAQLERGEVTAAAIGLERLAQEHGETSELARLRSAIDERRRQARAAELRQEAERQVAAGGLSQAVEILREGLSLAPGDAELAALLAAVERQRAERRAAAERAAAVEAARQGIEVALTRGELDAAEVALARAERSLGESFADLQEKLATAKAAVRSRQAAEAIAAGESALERGDFAAAAAAARRAEGFAAEDPAPAALLARVAAAEEHQREEAEALRARQAEEARQRSEEQRRRLEEEQRLAEEERRRRAEEERQRAEQDLLRAEEERRRQLAQLVAAAEAAFGRGDLAAAATTARRAQELAPDASAPGELLERVAAEERRLHAEQEEQRRREAEAERLRQVEAAATAAEQALAGGDLAAAEAAARRLQGLAASDPRPADLLARVAAETERRRAEEEERRRRRAEEERREHIATLAAQVGALAAAGKLRRARKTLDRGIGRLGEDEALAAAGEQLAIAEADAAAAGPPAGALPWRWIGAAAAGVAIVVAAVIWSGGGASEAGSTQGSDRSQVVATDGAPAGLPTVAPAGLDGFTDPVEDPATGGTEPDDASPAPDTAVADAAAERRRELVTRARNALGRRDTRGALAAARDAWRAGSDDPDVARLVADLTAAATADATAAAREAQTAGAPELAADAFRRAEAKRREGTRPGAAANPAGAAALWESVPLYARAATLANDERARRERVRQQEAAAQRERERLEEQARRSTPPAVPTTRPQPAEPRATERPAPAADARTEVRQAIERYRRAFEALDVAAVQAVWPGVRAADLQRSFAGFHSLEMQVSGCEVQPDGARATATCQLEQKIKPKVGSDLSSSRRVRFRLRQAGNDWLIDAIE